MIIRFTRPIITPHHPPPLLFSILSRNNAHTASRQPPGRTKPPSLSCRLSTSRYPRSLCCTGRSPQSRAAGPMRSALPLPFHCNMIGRASGQPADLWAGPAAPRCTSPHTRSPSSRRIAGLFVPFFCEVLLDLRDHCGLALFTKD